MQNDKEIFKQILKARENFYIAFREIKNKNEIYLTQSQYRLSKRFIEEINRMSDTLIKIFSKGIIK